MVPTHIHKISGHSFSEGTSNNPQTITECPVTLNFFLMVDNIEATEIIYYSMYHLILIHKIQFYYQLCPLLTIFPELCTIQVRGGAQ